MHAHISEEQKHLLQAQLKAAAAVVADTFPTLNETSETFHALVAGAVQALAISMQTADHRE